MDATLNSLISDVTTLTGTTPPALTSDDAPILSSESSDDCLYLIGLIGGKDVGKSSFVNALVGQQITEQSSHGPGTEAVIAYAHESVIQQLRALLDRHVAGRFKIHSHNISALKRQVLLDLPDIDSIYSDHIQITRTMLRQMLYPIWLQSVEKYADQQPQQLLARVAEGNDSANFIFCLNKADQLRAREGDKAIAEIRDDYAARIKRLLNLPTPPAVYMVSAQSPSEFDLPSLREALSKQKTTQIVRDSQQLAGRQQSRTVLAWLDAQQLPQRAARAGRLHEQATELVAERIGVPILEDALPRLVADPAYRLSIIDPVVTARMSHWPIVSIIHGLLTPLLAIIRRNLGRSANSGDEVRLNEYLSSSGESLSTKVQTTFALLQQTDPNISVLFRDNRLWESMSADHAAADLEQRLTDTSRRQRETAMERLGRRRGIFMPLIRFLLTIGALLWFPLIQPILETILQPDMTHFSRALLLRIVQLLGVTFLLKNLTFLLLWFAVLWAIVRSATHRRVSRLIARWQNDPKLDPSLSFTGQTIEWIDELLDPINQSHEKLNTLIARIEDLRTTLTTTRTAA
jgi:GTP-binding protein EngB required for normal cell division